MKSVIIYILACSFVLACTVFAARADIPSASYDYVNRAGVSISINKPIRDAVVASSVGVAGSPLPLRLAIEIGKSGRKVIPITGVIDPVLGPGVVLPDDKTSVSIIDKSLVIEWTPNDYGKEYLLKVEILGQYKPIADWNGPAWKQGKTFEIRLIGIPESDGPFLSISGDHLMDVQ